MIEHIQLVQDCDLEHPIILDHNGRVMDGMHRICKALLENEKPDKKKLIEYSERIEKMGLRISRIIKGLVSFATTP